MLEKWLILGLGGLVATPLAVVAHELGHLFVGQCLGAKVARLVLGWNGRFWWIGSVAGLPVVIREWPLSGYVEFLSRPSSRWARAAISLAGPAANFLLAGLAVVLFWRNPAGSAAGSTTMAGMLLIFSNGLMGLHSLRRYTIPNASPDLGDIQSDGLSIWRQIFPKKAPDEPVGPPLPWKRAARFVWTVLAVLLGFLTIMAILQAFGVEIPAAIVGLLVALSLPGIIEPTPVTPGTSALSTEDQYRTLNLMKDLGEMPQWSNPAEQASRWIETATGLWNPSRAADALATAALRENVLDPALLNLCLGKIEGALAANPDAITLEGTKGSLLAQLGRPEAEAVLEKVVTKSQSLIDHGIASMFLAEIYLRQGRPEDARRAAMRALLCYSESWVVGRAQAVLKMAAEPSFHAAATLP